MDSERAGLLRTRTAPWVSMQVYPAVTSAEALGPAALWGVSGLTVAEWMFCLHTHSTAEVRPLDTMTAIVVSRQRPPPVELLKDSLRQDHSRFKWRVPEGDLVLGLGRVKVEEAD